MSYSIKMNIYKFSNVVRLNMQLCANAVLFPWNSEISDLESHIYYLF